MRFADAVGAEGRVLAFEPSPAAIEQLKASSQKLHNVEIVNAALSDFDGESEFFASDTGESVTDGFAPKSAGARLVKVPTARGDTFGFRVPPSIVKIDVEGFELEVLRGMTEVLRSPKLRGVFIEVHFLASVERGEAQAPARLVETLRDAGLSYRWVDASHLVAVRN